MDFANIILLLAIIAAFGIGFWVNRWFNGSKTKSTENAAILLERISNIPEPTILAIDHDLDYYDISQSSFNRFKAEDYTRLNKKAKDSIADKANESELLQSAKLQGNKMLEVVRTMGESMG
jgi:hypothetical protein